MVAAIPFTVCTARNSPATGAGFAGLRSHSSSRRLQALKCSRLSAKNSSAYCERSMTQPRTRCTASSTRDGWNGLTTKSFAPAWIASTTRACWPIALHIKIFASGSCLMISRTASIPPMSGITMSMVTRSGLSCLYFSTAWDPVSASPTISKPAWARMSLIIVRMKMASSQTRTVWPTHPSLGRQDRSQQRVGIEHHEQLPGAPPHRVHQRGVHAGQGLPALQGVRPGGEKVHHLVDREAEDPLAPVHLEENGGLRRRRRRLLPERPPPLHHGHQRAPHVGEPRHRGADEVAHPEQQQPDDPRVTHPMRRSQDTPRGWAEQAKWDRPPPAPA